MKKIYCLILALVLLMSLAACGGTEVTLSPTEPTEQGNNAATQPSQSQEAPNTQPAPEQQEAGFVFSYNGVDIAMNAPAEEIVAALGEPKSYTEEASCAFVGMDKTYYYGSFYLQTYPMEDQDFVYCLWIVDDTVTTPEGLYIGAGQNQVEAALGAESFNGSNAYILSRGDSTLTVILENGAVSSIQYDAIVE